MNNQEKTVHLIQTLPTEFPEGSDEGEDKLETGKFYYDTFAFRDRITNNRFQYREARENRELHLSFLEWTTNESAVSRELKNSLKVYKYTKNFEMDCIRAKYLRQTHSEKTHSKPSLKSLPHGQDPAKLTRDELFRINKQEMRRILQTNGHVKPDILKLNNSINCPAKNIEQKSPRKPLLKWGMIENAPKDLGVSSEGQVRVTEKLINHMKHEIRSNCEYLLNMPIAQRKKALFKNQLNKYRHAKKAIVPNFSHLDITNCRFTASKEEQRPTVQQGKDFKEDERRVVELVKRGFINEVCLQLKDNDSLCMSKDDVGNNIFHTAAKEGNANMANMLLKVISPRNCLHLLADRNHLKRTPQEKALLLGQREVGKILDDFLREHQQMI